MPLSQPVDRQNSSRTSDARQFFVYRLMWIRGVCVLSVILIHVTGIASLAGHDVDWVTAILIYVKSLARFGVPIFVVLSGFHLSLNTRNERPVPFYRRTLKLLIVPYVVYSSVYVLATCPTGGRILHVWLRAVLLGTAYGHLWFIPVIVELYLLHPFLRRLYRGAEHSGRLVALALTIQLVCGVVGEIAARSVQGEQWLRVVAVALSFLPYVGYFVLGYFLLDHAADIGDAMRRPLTRITAGVVWAMTAAIIAAYSVVPTLHGRTIAYPGLALTLLAPPLSVAAFVVLAAWHSRSWIPRPVNWLVHVCGLYAYGVYFLHPLVLLFVSWGLTEAVGLGWDNAAFYALAFPLVSVLSVFAVKLLARLPFTRYLA